MKILIVAATEKELTPFLDWNGVTPFVWHNLENNSILVTFAGVGVVAATFLINEYIDKYSPDLVIQAGIAGCYENNGLKVGDTLFIDSERLGDLGVFDSEKLKRIFVEDNELENSYKFPEIKLKKVSGNTVNSACAQHVDSTGVAVESMEGYALFYVCLRKKVKFIEIRTISNIVSTDRSSWNLKLATENLSHTLKELCNLSYTK